MGRVSHHHEHGHEHGHENADEPYEPFTREFWDHRYGGSERVWSGNPNQRLVEQVAALRRDESQVPEGGRGRDPAARRALQEALLDQEGLDHVFDGVTLFPDGCRQVVQPDGAAVELVQHGLEQFAVHEVKRSEEHTSELQSH